MINNIVLLLFLVSGVACLDYHTLQVDEISGELLKPSNWSDAKFLTVQQLRLSVRRIYSKLSIYVLAKSMLIVIVAFAFFQFLLC